MTHVEDGLVWVTTRWVNSRTGHDPTRRITAKVGQAWAKTYPENKHVKFLADGAGKYTHALGLELDLSDKGLGVRSRRYALLVDDLEVKVANIESGGEFTVSGADEILNAL
ncbi:hypothetical protein KY285_030191 [Solanum tuberosum]|nr:hypothetical protein KY284_030083 [Solanum tuberosum]KAH0655309.1 hypothetical protein KY285_030191 [Solanum tuberosum]